MTGTDIMIGATGTDITTGATTATGIETETTIAVGAGMNGASTSDGTGGMTGDIYTSISVRLRAITTRLHPATDISTTRIRIRAVRIEG